MLKDKERRKTISLLFLDEKKQKSTDRTEFTKNPMYSLNLPILSQPSEDF
jgi:hypothetical protein